MGDSITEGAGSTAGYGGYRKPLFNLLTAGGFNFDFVGTNTANSSLVGDPDHEGHGGWVIGQLDSNLVGWLNAIDVPGVDDPDILLLHIGTNNFGSGAANFGAIDEFKNFVRRVTQLRPNMHIVVTNLMQRGGAADTHIQAEFNPYVKNFADDLAAHGALVTFLDMRAAVPISDMPDQLHPNDTGYAKMANAWYGAIQQVVEPGDAVAPALIGALGGETQDKVIVRFNRILDPATAANPANYSIDGGLNVISAALSPSNRSVTLTTSPQTSSQSYTLSVSNVKDIAPTPNTIAANSTVGFFGAVARGYGNHVTESDCFNLVYSLEIPAAANYSAGVVTYDTDNRLRVGSFDRVAYYMELQKPGEPLRYAWVSMAPFTTDIAKIGVPTGATFQSLVGPMTVETNMPGVVSGEISNGNIEFWPTNYNVTNSLPVVGASSTVWDFGDQPAAGNYGSMQIHNTDVGQTIMAFNRWGGVGGTVDLGMGNRPTDAPDWTMAQNGAGYTIKRLQVLVRTTGDTTPPVLAAANSQSGGGGIRVRFDEPVRADTLVSSNFTVDQGVVVLGATVGNDLHEVFLQTSRQPGTALLLTVNGVRDTSANANLIAANSTIAVGAPVLPPEIATNIGPAANGYELVYSLDIPSVGTLNTGNPYNLDNSADIRGFDRVAYYLELQTASTPSKFVWVSMNAFTTNAKRIGVPLASSGAFFQQKVTGMDVISSGGSGVTQGTALATGNIEFWPSNYNESNAISIPGASASTFDFGDGSANGTAGYGSMQIHNHGAGQTIFALNNWGVDGKPLCLGIGNQPTGSPDWTFAENAATYTRKIMHVLVRPTPVPAAQAAPAEVLANVPEASDYEMVYTLDIPATGNLAAGPGFKDYTYDASTRSTSFSRVAYYMALQKAGEPSPTYVWVSMDAFTTQRGKIGVPSVASGALWQQNVANMNVVSNSAAVTPVTGATGNLEFWPGSYNATNDHNVPGASATGYDFGDGGAGAGYGHGSMQVHNFGAKQTLFALNHWGANGNTTNVPAIGIGNDPAPGADTDWTFNYNASAYNVLRRLYVFVKPGVSPIQEGPAFESASGSTTLNRLAVLFDREVSDTAANPANFAISGGLTVTGARLLPSNREIALETSAQTAGAAYTVSATGILARTASGGSIAPGATIAFTAYTPPAALVHAEAGYDLIYQLAIPAVQPQWNLKTIPYSVNEARYGERLFDRVAYLMELDGNWVSVSFDPHTQRIAQTGVPSLNVSSVPFQQKVTNMNVASNVPAIVTGNGISTGNIEFWGGNYEQPNGFGIPGASEATYDFGDRMTSGGHAGMQVHNYGAAQTLFGYNDWGSNNTGGFSDLGIGNNGTGIGDPDWTFGKNANTYTNRNLYVLARSGGVPSGDAPVIFSQPCDRSADLGDNISFAVTAEGSGPFTYQWRHNGSVIAGETRAWLELNNISVTDPGSYDVIVTGPNFVSTISATAVLTVIGVNQAPTFSGFSFAVQMDGSVIISTSAILARAADADGGTLALTAAGTPTANGGSVVLGANDLTYSPATGFVGNDSVSVTITDGQGGSTPAILNVNVTRQAIVPGGSDSVIILSGGGVEGVFHGTPGQEYQFQRSTELTVWQNFGAAVVADFRGVLILNDPTPPTPKSFYRTATPAPAAQ